jgi:hypothetical protein
MAVGIVSGSIPTGGVLDTGGNNSTSSSPVSSGNRTAVGGYITEINITANNQQTTNWQGFLGNVTGGNIFLNDSSGNSMYNWATVVANGGFVYATTKSTAPSWSTVTAILAATLDGASYWKMGAKSDNISNTYKSMKNLNVSGISVTGANYTTVNTYFNNSVISEAGPSGKDNVIWVAEINNDQLNFKNKYSDYELLVPVNAGDIYFFYTEIS